MSDWDCICFLACAVLGMLIPTRAAPAAPATPPKTLDDCLFDLEARREVDEMLPGTPPIAPPR